MMLYLSIILVAIPLIIISCVHNSCRIDEKLADKSSQKYQEAVALDKIRKEVL